MNNERAGDGNRRRGFDPAMTKVRLPPTGFWSYARRDDDLSEDNLTRLRDLVKREIQLQYGRDDIKLFQDTATIPHGAAWERETLQALSESTFFIPIITPNFIQSEWCCREVAIFLEREQELLALYPDLPARSRIFPIDYRRIQDGNAHDPAMLAALRERQWCEFQSLRDEDPRSKLVKTKINELAESICDLLFVEVERPISAAERARSEAAQQDGRASAVAAGPRHGDRTAQRRRQPEAEALDRERAAQWQQARDERERDAAKARRSGQATRADERQSPEQRPASEIDKVLLGLLALGAVLFAAIVAIVGEGLFDERHPLKALLATMVFGLPAAGHRLLKAKQISLVLYFLLFIPVFHLLAMLLAFEVMIGGSDLLRQLSGAAGGIVGAGSSFLALPLLRLGRKDPPTLKWALLGIGVGVLGLIGSIGVRALFENSLRTAWPLVGFFLSWQLVFAFFLAKLVVPCPPEAKG